MYSQADGESYFSNALLIIAAVLVIGVILLVGDNLLKIEAKKSGVTKENGEFSIFPSFSSFFNPKKPDYVNEAGFVGLNKGHDILLEGDPEEEFYPKGGSKTFSIQPGNFIGMSPIPKVEVEVGDEVKAGDVLFWDKKRPEIKFVAPVSGEIIAVERGAKRAIAGINILADKEIKYKSFTAPDLSSTNRADLVQFLLDSGGWTMLRQRPFDIIPAPADQPKNIFVSTFDTAPLAPDLDFVVEGKEAAFQKGLDVLNILTDGFVHLGLDGRDSELAPSAAFTEAEGVKKTYFSGPHPSGNVGIQIHHVAPINAGEKTWYLGVQEVITLGGLFLEGKFDGERRIAVGGSELKHPAYYNTYIGANINDLIADHLIFGWLLPLAPRPSISKTFPNFIFGDIKFEGNTNTHGEERAFVVTGQYEEVLPMDIYPQHLMKAIMMNDFERMEGLGIYELSEEDIALCEFACTSKQPLQHILREGLDLMREQV